MKEKVEQKARPTAVFSSVTLIDLTLFLYAHHSSGLLLHWGGWQRQWTFRRYCWCRKTLVWIWCDSWSSALLSLFCFPWIRIALLQTPNLSCDFTGSHLLILLITRTATCHWAQSTHRGALTICSLASKPEDLNRTRTLWEWCCQRWRCGVRTLLWLSSACQRPGN